MAKKLEGKVAVVTGASKGIGAEIARQLAAEGAAVVVNYASSKAGADKVVAEITGKGGKAVAVQADVAKEADIKRLFAETKKAFGRLDILVNNAGIYEFAPLEAVTAEHFHKQFDLNVLGLILSTQEAVKQFGLRRRQRHQHQLGGRDRANPERVGLQRHEGGGGCRDAVAGGRTRAAEDPGQLDQPGHGRDRGRALGRHRRERLPQAGRGADAARPHRSAAGHRPGGRVPRLERLRVDHRRDVLHRRRPPVSRNRRGF